MQDITSIITIASFLGGIAIFLFKKIVIEPLQKSIDQLNQTIQGFKETAEKRMDKIEIRLDTVEDKSIEHGEQIKTLFNLKKGAETR